MLANEAKYSKYFHKTQIRIKRCFYAVSEIETVSCNREEEEEEKFADFSDRNSSRIEYFCLSARTEVDERAVRKLLAATLESSFSMIGTATATAKDLAGVLDRSKLSTEIGHARECSRLERRSVLFSFF